jgi:hypothetical protein
MASLLTRTRSLDLHEPAAPIVAPCSNCQCVGELHHSVGDQSFCTGGELRVFWACNPLGRPTGG